MPRIETPVPDDYGTRMKIIRAIATLCGHTPIDKISTVSICKTAGLSRQTFYRHFKDKYDAISWFCTMDSKSSLCEIGRTLTWLEGTTKMFQSMETEMAFYSIALKTGDYYGPAASGARWTYLVWRETIESINHIQISETLEFQLMAWSQICPTIARHYIQALQEGMTPRREGELLASCVPHELSHAMDDPVLERRRTDNK